MTYILGVLTPAEKKKMTADGWRLLEPQHIDLGLEDLWALFTDDDITEIAKKVARVPPDFGEYVASLFAQGLDDAEVLGHLDADTAGTDLLALVRKLMTKPVNDHLVSCCFCHQETPEATAHVHQMEWVCDECWDERLRTTS